MTNSQIRHAIKGKLSPALFLAQLIHTQYDDETSDNIGAEGQREIQKMIPETAEQVLALMPEIIELLDKIEENG